MKKGSEHPDSTRKKLVGEYLRNADKLLKSGDYEVALTEVEKSLELEPGNFYAQAYKDRINALREKHAPPGEKPTASPIVSQPARSGLASTPPPVPDATERPGTELTEITGARIEELPAVEPVFEDHGNLTELKDQIARDRATHETETTRQTEVYAIKALEDELRQHEESDRLKAVEAQALAGALAGAAAEALAAVVTGSKEAFGKLLAAGDTEGAYRELSRITIVDPGDAVLGSMRKQLESATRSGVGATAGESKQMPREIALQWFGKLLRSAWGEGTPNRVQAAEVAIARKRLAVSADEEKALLAGIQREIMTEAMRDAYKDGEPDPETKSFLETLARELSVGDLGALTAPPTK